MKTTSHTNQEQAMLWNGLAGRAWVEEEKVVDRMFEPFERLLVEAAFAASRTRVLDVGCGTGGTTLAIARRLGAASRCVGLDLSEPMVAAARARGEREGVPASFICADAQSYDFEPKAFDLITSRFGVMFFDDPVQAFANLRRAGTDDAECRFIAWRSAAENPFMTTAERAAAPFLPNLPARQADAPGQFAFADQRRVRRVLEESGWTGVDIRPIEVSCSLLESELIGYLTRLGPVGRVLHQVDEPTRARVIEAARAAFEGFVQGAEVRFDAACWMVGARASSPQRK